MSVSCLNNNTPLPLETLNKFDDFAIYPIEFKMKDTTDTARSASYLDLHIDCRLRTNAMIFTFPIVTFPCILARFQQYLHTEYISLS